MVTTQENTSLLLRQRPSINTLPMELLLMIFKEVYIAAYGGNLGASEKLAWSPYFIFVVCSLWRKVAKRLPLYATRVMIYINEPVSIPDLEDEISLSIPMPVKVFVVRKLAVIVNGEEQQPEQKPEEDEEDPLEKERVAEVIILLARHIDRCQVLVIDLLLRSSLPCMSGFCGYAPKLLTLRLKSNMVDSMNKLPPITKLLPPFICSSLRYLDFDGAIFARAVQIPRWQDSMRGLAKKEISITNLFSGDYGDFDLHDLVSALSYSNLGHIASLKFCNIHLNTDRCHTDMNPILLFVQNIEFVGLPMHMIVGFFAIQNNHIDVSTLKIRECEVSAVDSFQCRNLELHDIDGTSDDITAFIRNWDGFSLRISKCPMVDDSLLRMLAEYETIDEPRIFYVPSIRQISISAFPLITAKALKDLIIARKELATKYKPPPNVAPTYLPMHSVWLTGTGPPLLAEDRKWLAGNLEYFTWYTPRAGFESPRLESDFCEWEDIQKLETVLIDVPLVVQPGLLQEQLNNSMHSDASSVAEIDAGFLSPIVSSDYSTWSIDDLSTDLLDSF